MDRHQQHAHPAPPFQEHIDMQQDPALQTPYGFYQEADPGYSSIPFDYGVQQVIPNAHQPQLQQFPFRTIGGGLMPNHQYPNPAYPPSSSPPNLNLPPNASSPPPPSPTYAASPPLSSSDTSADGIYVSRNSSGATSPSSSRGGSLVHRNSLRYNPTPSPSNSSSGRRRGRSFDSESDEPLPNMMSVVQEISHNRKEATRRQRIEAEQRRRDELRDGYARLKDVLPVSNQKSSKVSLLERATNYIINLDKQTRQMQTRLAALEGEVQRLRALNEKISISVGSTPEATAHVLGQTMVHNMERPLSPPPESGPQSHPPHNLVPVTSQPPHEDSDGSDEVF